VSEGPVFREGKGGPKKRRRSLGTRRRVLAKRKKPTKERDQGYLVHLREVSHWLRRDCTKWGLYLGWRKKKVNPDSENSIKKGAINLAKGTEALFAEGVRIREVGVGLTKRGARTTLQ